MTSYRLVGQVGNATILERNDLSERGLRRLVQTVQFIEFDKSYASWVARAPRESSKTTIIAIPNLLQLWYRILSG